MSETISDELAMTPQPKEQDDELDMRESLIRMAQCHSHGYMCEDCPMPDNESEFIELLDKYADKRAAERETAGRQREAVLLDALAGVYEQYCNGKHGHNFMGAGERAIEVLENYGVHDEAREWNDRSEEELEKALNTLKGSDQ